MNRAFLTEKGEYFASFKSKNILNGAIKEVLVINPLSEIKEHNFQMKLQLAISNRKLASQKINETDGEEREGYEVLLEESNKIIKEISEKKFHKKVKKLRCHIIANVIGDYYKINVMLPKSWQNDYKYVFEALDEKQRQSL